MTDEIPTTNPTPASEPAPGPEAAPGPATAEAWNDVIARMGELGMAVSAWAKSAADDPQNRQRLQQVRAGVDEMARQADAAFNKVTSTEFGQQVAQGAQQAGDAIGDAAQQVSEAAAPHVSNALSGLAGMFEKAATKLDEAFTTATAPSGTPAPPAPPADAQAAPSAPTPAPAAPPSPPAPPSDGTPEQP